MARHQSAQPRVRRDLQPCLRCAVALLSLKFQQHVCSTDILARALISTVLTLDDFSPDFKGCCKRADAIIKGSYSRDPVLDKSFARDHTKNVPQLDQSSFIELASALG